MLLMIPSIGSDVIPDTVHHVVCRVDPSKHPLQGEATYPAITDEVHLKPLRNSLEETSQRVKERKQHLLVHLVDKYEVGC